MDRTLQTEISARLEEAAGDRALGFASLDGAIQWRTFGEIHQQAARHASILADRGLAAGDVCVIVLPSDEFCASVLVGSLLLGARPLLVAPPIVRGLHSNLKEVVRHVIGTTRARVLIVDEDGEAVGREIRKAGETQVVFGAQDCEGGDPAAAPLAMPSAADLAALQLTSGTTGFPRICMWRQERVLAALDGMECAMQVDGSDVCVNWTPLYHDMGLVNNFLLCMVKRIPLVMVGTMDFLKRPALWLRVLRDAGGTVTWSPNFGFAVAAQRIGDAELEGVRLDHVRAFWNAAERIHLETILRFHRRFEPYGVSMGALKTNFGCAENVGGATFSDPEGEFVYERVDASQLFEDGVAREVAAAEEGVEAVSVVGVGRPFPGMSIMILASDGRELPDGHVGEIALASPSRMEGYLGDPDETARVVKEDFVLTGDFGYKRGGEVFWAGRTRERINLHGKKYDPSDFEKALFEIEGLREGSFAAFGVDDVELGTQRLVILAEVRDSNTRPHDEILLEIREQLTTQQGVNVSEVLLLPQGSMTKTSSGKRRHRFYKELHRRGELEPVASWKRP